MRTCLLHIYSQERPMSRISSVHLQRYVNRHILLASITLLEFFTVTGHRGRKIPKTISAKIYTSLLSLALHVAIMVNLI